MIENKRKISSRLNSETSPDKSHLCLSDNKSIKHFMRIKNIVSTALIVFVFILSTAAISTAASFEEKVDQYLKAHSKLGSFNGSVLIAKKGKLLFKMGYGMANIEHEVKNTSATKFRLGSVSKQFTAAAILLSEEKGLLKVSDTLSKYIPDYPRGDEITIHHLLTHSSGIHNILENDEFLASITLPTNIEKTIAFFMNKPLDFKPGEKFSYSNSGYILLAYIIERASKTSYEKFLEENIFKPLSMKNTGVDHHANVLKNRASGYFIDKDGLINASYINMDYTLGGGCLYSTVDDLYLWDRALRTEKLLNNNHLEKMFTAYNEKYGYGWFITKPGDRVCYSHSGSIEGFAACISRFPEEDICIITLSNFQHSPISKINNDLAAILFGKPYEIPKEQKTIDVDDKILKQYVGEYEVAPGATINVTFENGALYIAPPGQPAARLISISEREFIIKEFDAKITFVKNKEGSIENFIFVVQGKEMIAKKIK